MRVGGSLMGLFCPPFEATTSKSRRGFLTDLLHFQRAASCLAPGLGGVMVAVGASEPKGGGAGLLELKKPNSRGYYRFAAWRRLEPSSSPSANFLDH